MNAQNYTCERCGKKHLGVVTYLELDNKSDRFFMPGGVPSDSSQGCFPFGSSCANAVLKNGGKLKRIGKAAQ